MTFELKFLNIKFIRDSYKCRFFVKKSAFSHIEKRMFKMNEIINKSMDLENFDKDKLNSLLQEIMNLEDEFSKNNCNISSWYGNFEKIKFYDKLEKLNRGYAYKNILPKIYDIKYPSFLIWEIYTVINTIEFKKGDTVLDIGGACSLFSFYLESKGVNVITIDKNPVLVEEANRVAKKLNLNYKAINCDAEDFVNSCNDKFNVITSICVFEHIELEKRKRIIRNLHKILKQDGKIALTFDYRNPSRFVNINNPTDVKEQFGCSQQLKIMGNEVFYDNEKNYLVHGFFHKKFFIKYKIRSIRKGNFKPIEFFKVKFKNDYTFGSMFLEIK